MPTTFQRPVNDYSSALDADHLNGDGALVLTPATGAALGTLGANEVFRVTLVEPLAGGVLKIMEATGRTTDTLTGVTAVEGYSDSDALAGTVVQVRPTAKTFSELQSAVHALESGSAGGGETLFVHSADAGNVTTTKTALYDDTVAGGALAANGDMLEFDYGGSVTGGTSTKTISLNFGGVEIATSGALTPAAGSFRVRGYLIRKTSTTARAVVSVEVNGLATEDVSYTPDGTLTGLDFALGAHLVLYGQAGGVGAASNDVVAGIGKVKKEPAP